MTVQYDFSSLVGKTISSVEHNVGEFINGLTTLRIDFTDGDHIVLQANGCDEGGWMSVSPDEFDN